MFVLHFRDYTASDYPYAEVRGKSGRILKETRKSRCIARFKTEKEAYEFIHHLHQSKSKKYFFPVFGNLEKLSEMEKKGDDRC